MSRPNDSSVQGEGEYRVLKLGPVRVHNGHLQAGLSSTRGCPVCVEGLEGFMAADTGPQAKPEVAEGDGGDPEDDAALALSRWSDPG